MEKETKMQLVAKLTQLKLLSKMYEHTFKNAGNQMSRQKMDELKVAKLLQKSEMRKDIVIELSYKGFG